MDDHTRKGTGLANTVVEHEQNYLVGSIHCLMLGHLFFAQWRARDRQTD